MKIQDRTKCEVIEGFDFDNLKLEIKRFLTAHPHAKIQHSCLVMISGIYEHIIYYTECESSHQIQDGNITTRTVELVLS